MANYSNSLLKQIDTYQNKQLLKQNFRALDLDIYKDYIAKDINVNNLLTQSQKNVVEDTFYLQLTLITAIGVLVALPESISKWDLSALEEQSLSEKWKENVKAGPVWDEDEFAINYIGHPLSGAWYYTMARNNGLDPFGSFIYSVFVSSIIWEYGYEAFAEIPSIQDLISTPVLGSLLGEYFYYLEGEIDKNRGLVFGSKYLGNFSYFAIDPLGNIADGIGGFIGASVTMRFQTYQPYNNKAQTSYDKALQKPEQFSSYDYGVIINLEY